MTRYIGLIGYPLKHSVSPVLQQAALDYYHLDIRYESRETKAEDLDFMIEILDWDGNVVWSKTLATDTYLSNHDVAVLPNGNILAIVWEAKSAADVLALGRTSVSDASVWAGAVYEICRHSATNNCTDGDIVWRWSSWDHVAQNVDSSIPGTYVSNMSDHPDRINLNYVPGQSATGFPDWMHFNGIDYNAQKDQILISVHNFNEYWII